MKLQVFSVTFLVLLITPHPSPKHYSFCHFYYMCIHYIWGYNSDQNPNFIQPINKVTISFESLEQITDPISSNPQVSFLSGLAEHERKHVSLVLSYLLRWSDFLLHDDVGRLRTTKILFLLRQL